MGDVSAYVSSEKHETPEPAANQGGHNLLELFGQGLKNSVMMPLAGSKQLMHDDSAAKEYFRNVDNSQLSTSEGLASQAGSLIGNAALFIGGSMLAKKIPFIGKFAPIAVGAGLGYLEPLHQGEGEAMRFAHAGLGAATISILEYGPKRMPAFGFNNELARETSRVAVAGFGAGMVNAEAQSLLNTGKLVSLDDAAKSGVAWGLTGAAFHTVGTSLGKLQPLGIGTPKQGEVFVVGSRFSDECFTTRDFLQKNHIPFKVYDPEQNFFARRLMAKSGASSKIILPDGRQIECGEPMQLARDLGMHTKPTGTEYDTIVIGAGPAGLQASIYSSSEGLKTLMIDGRGPGGQAATTSRIENFMGFENGVSGPDFTSKAFAQTKRLGTEFVLNEVKGLNKAEDGTLTVELRDGSIARARSVVVATGVQFRAMGDIPNMTELQGKGVYYGAALTEAPLTKPGERVFIVGGANSAGQAAVKYSELVGKNGRVTILTRSPLEKGMSQYLIDQIKASRNIVVETGATIDSVAGENRLETVTYSNQKTRSTTSAPAESMFVFIGSAPKTHWLSANLALDEQGFLKSGLAAKQGSAWNLERNPYANETSIPGVFTAGDVHSGTAKRIITAAGEGANSISQVHQWLSTPEAAKPFQSRSPVAAVYAPKATAEIAGIWPELPRPHIGLMRVGAWWGQHERDRMAFPFRFAT